MQVICLCSITVKHIISKWIWTRNYSPHPTFHGNFDKILKVILISRDIAAQHKETHSQVNIVQIASKLAKGEHIRKYIMLL